MLIDWFTVIAQLVNFLILIWLLKKFLYRPILKAVDAREKSISEQLKNAEQRETEANNQRLEFLEKNQEYTSKYNELMEKALRDAKKKKDDLFEEVRRESVEMRNRLLESFENEKQVLANEIVQKTRNEVFSIARKVLADLSTSSLEDQMLEVFLSRLNSMPEEDRVRLVSKIEKEAKPFRINSAFEISSDYREKIEKSLRQIISSTSDHKKAVSIVFEFEEIPEQLSGIELLVNGYKLAWSISDYLGTMERHVADLLKEKVNIEATG